MPTLICDCNKTMPLAAQRLSQALGETLPLHSTLCRREAGAFQQAVRGPAEVVVACTQERQLFSELAAQTEGAVAPLRFVNIRETGGWSRDAREATPKIAALLAAARLPDPEPVTTVTYKSEGRLLIVGPLGVAEPIAASLRDVLEVTLFTTGGGGRDGAAGAAAGLGSVGAQAREYPVLGGRVEAITGWLGAFELHWRADNPIDLDLCTRCNACVAACPEGAIGLDYQIDMARCSNHRACVKACDAAGAIDFTRDAQAQSERFDVVLDLREQPAFTQHAPPQGYFHLPAKALAAGGSSLPVSLGEGSASTLATILKLRSLVGEFDKPRFFQYKQKLCAHSRNEQVGCRACIDICSAEAISSELVAAGSSQGSQSPQAGQQSARIMARGAQDGRQQIKVNPNLCVGCGACTTVCPTGALTFAYPRAPEQGTKLRTLLAAYAQAGGRDGAILLHSQEQGAALVEQLGRAARLGQAHGVPARVIPVALWHTASTGIDLWLSAIAHGANQVAVLLTGEEAPQYVQGLKNQMAVAQTLLHGLGYSGTHFALIEANTPTSLDAALLALSQSRQVLPSQVARYAVTAEKRATLEFALDHLIEQARTLPSEPIALPAAGSPFGAIEVNKDRCTLCLSCVSACPASALQDNPLLPQLRFVEKSCVQCGLCASTCPENAITLVPRLLPTPERKQPRVLNETQPYACIRCAKPFGTLKAIEAMLGKLAGHAMFQGEAQQRLKMCGDCRVIDLYSATNEAKINDL